MTTPNKFRYCRTTIGFNARADNHSDGGMSSEASLDAKELMDQMIALGLLFYFAQQHVNLPLSIPAASHPLVVMRPFEMVDTPNATTTTAPHANRDLDVVAIAVSSDDNRFPIARASSLLPTVGLVKHFAPRSEFVYELLLLLFHRFVLSLLETLKHGDLLM